jgi:DNA polymerase elongation subunit (family B)
MINFNKMPDDYLIEIEMGDEVMKMTKVKFLEMLKQEQLTISSTGVMYDQKKIGIIPDILTRWFDERVEYKNLMKKYGKAGDTKNYEFYDSRQHAQKILLNSLYGVLGLPTFRYYDLDNAEAVTLTGQDVIRYTQMIINNYYKKQINEEDDFIIYTDTDSCFLSVEKIVKYRFPDADLDDDEFMTKQILQIATEIQKYINNSYDFLSKKFFNTEIHQFFIKQEVIAKTGFWTGKKHYALNIINREGIPEKRLDVKGMDTVKASFPPAFKTFLKTMLVEILENKNDKEYYDKKIVEFKNSIPKLDYKEVSSTTSVKQVNKYIISDDAFDSKAKGTPVHVKAALNYNDVLKLKGLDDKIMPIRGGDKVKWVYLKLNPLRLQELAYKGQEDEDPQEILDYVSQYVDYDKAFEKGLKNKIQAFYDALNWGTVPDYIDDACSDFFDF